MSEDAGWILICCGLLLLACDILYERKLRRMRDEFLALIEKEKNANV